MSTTQPEERVVGGVRWTVYGYETEGGMVRCYLGDEGDWWLASAWMGFGLDSVGPYPTAEEAMRAYAERRQNS